MSGVEHACLDERGQRRLVPADVQLIARRAVERAAAVRADLGMDAELPQERESPPCDTRAGDVEMERDPSADDYVLRPGTTNPSK